MIKAVIIDDEKKARESLKKELKDCGLEVNVIGEAESVKKGMTAIQELKPELVFLDIELSDGMAFDLLEALRKEGNPFDFNIIFITSHNEYAINAIKFSALDYLLKPIDSDELAAAVKKFADVKIRKNSYANLNVLLENKQHNKTTAKIALAVSDSILIYKVEDIIRCESERNYTMFHFRNDKPLLVSKTLKEYEDLLKEYGFERVHHSHLVNLNYIKKYIKGDGGSVMLEDGSQIPISPSKKERLIHFLSSL